MPSPTNPLGVKAGGEGGTTPAPAAIASAIADALDLLGVDDVPMPATPGAIWRAINGHGGPDMAPNPPNARSAPAEP